MRARSSKGYHRAMARTQTMVQLSDELVTLLDEEAEQKGVSRSALIRAVLTDYLRTAAEVSVGRRIAEGYERIPPATPDAWGELDALVDHGTRDLLARLDAEERDKAPW